MYISVSAVLSDFFFTISTLYDQLSNDYFLCFSSLAFSKIRILFLSPFDEILKSLARESLS